MSNDKKILIVDANNAVWRLMKKLPYLSVDGMQVQVVYGFLRLLRGLIAQFEPTTTIVCWDNGHSDFRKKTFPGYKANRIHGNDSEYSSCMQQIREIKEILKHLNVAQIDHPGTEADDLVGLICGEGIKGKKIVASSDQDMLQLVNDDISVWSPMKSILYTNVNFKKYIEGLSPIQYLQMRALCGDHSDNIPGVAKGFGETTAIEVLKKYENLEKLFSPVVEKKLVNKGNRYALLYSEGAKERAYRNLLIMDLSVCGHFIKDKEALLNRIKRSLTSERQKIDKAKVKEFFLRKDFRSMLKDFGAWISPFEDLDWSEK